MLRIASLGFQTEKRALLYRSALDSKPKNAYLPFLPPLSSFLPFFFMEAPSLGL
jgi:hypothetical protein